MPHRLLASHHTPGCGPTLIFLPGYASDMTGTKALAVEDWARANGRACLRFDYAGCGASPGDFEDFTLADWRDDALAMIDRIAGPVVLIGSSMGGWIMLLAALARPERVAALIGIAPAPDFTDWGYSGDEKAILKRHGQLEQLSPYSDHLTVTTFGFWEAGESLRLMQAPIAIDAPVRLIHGQRDPDVPWEHTVQLAALIRSDDVQTILIKDGDHRLSRDADIATLLRHDRDAAMILALLLQIAAPPETAEARFDRCTDLATTDGGAGAADASAWVLGGGGFLARQCLGLAYATGGNYVGAAGAFEQAARAAEIAQDRRSANYWAQAGNAWLAAGDSAKARAALDAALSGGALTGLALGEAYLDRARAAVAAGNTAAARTDIDLALVHAAADPLAWLLSATLARRDKDVARAQKDIGEAVRRAGDDAAVQLEVGNIAALAGDEAGARGGWTKAAQLGGSGAVAASARAALAQFDAGK